MNHLQFVHSHIRGIVFSHAFSDDENLYLGSHMCPQMESQKAVCASGASSPPRLTLSAQMFHEGLLCCMYCGKSLRDMSGVVEGNPVFKMRRGSPRCTVE